MGVILCGCQAALMKRGALRKEAAKGVLTESIDIERDSPFSAKMGRRGPFSVSNLLLQGGS